MLAPEHGPPLAHEEHGRARGADVLLAHVHRGLQEHHAARLAEEVVVVVVARARVDRDVLDARDELLVRAHLVVRRVDVVGRHGLARHGGAQGGVEGRDGGVQLLVRMEGWGAGLGAGGGGCEGALGVCVRAAQEGDIRRMLEVLLKDPISGCCSYMLQRRTLSSVFRISTIWVSRLSTYLNGYE